MKLQVNDRFGTKCLAVLKLDGAPAIEGTDYMKWEGTYHKDGKWSYSEGGVALQNGIVIINYRSTHRSGDQQKSAIVIVGGCKVDEFHICGRMDETQERPSVPRSWNLGTAVWIAVLNAVVQVTGESGQTTLHRWAEMERFSAPQPTDMQNFVAVLSTTVLPLDGTYKVDTLPRCPDLTGVPHYVGHPDTRDIVQALGAVPAPSKLFAGLQPGQRAICFPIQQGKSNRLENGFTCPHQTVQLQDLQVRVITRLA